ncbi:MAG: hypothetical protein Q9207_005522 [Kuettlingeria erythrocarpa]
MPRTFDLFKRTDVPLIDYHLSGENTPKRYNGITVFPAKGDAPVEEDPFHVSESKGGVVPDDKVLEEAFAPLKEALKRGDAESFKLFEELDDYTVRDYLREKIATGLFDLAFDYGPEEEEWKSVDGGTNLLTEAMVDMLKTKPIYNKRMTRVALDRQREGENKMAMVTNYGDPPKYYTSVINTTTLACLQRIDTTDLELSPTIKIATRTLHYDSSTKVAIKVDKPWWITKRGIKSGGVANTDLPIRICVYPSYNFQDDPEQPSVLLCTYNWAQDATRIGSLVNSDSPRGEDEFKGLMLYNLARLHSNESNFEEMYAMIKASYITHHGFDWAMDDYSSGTFALFGPGQFRALYPHLIRPQADSTS